MPLSRMENTTFAMPSIIDSHDMGLRTVLQSRSPKGNAYSTPIFRKEAVKNSNSSKTKYPSTKSTALFVVGQERSSVLRVPETGENHQRGSVLQSLDKLNAAIKEKRPALASRKGIVVHHDNARPHTPMVTQQKLNALGCKFLGHPPYSSDIAPSDYYLFKSLQNYLTEKNASLLKVFQRQLLTIFTPSTRTSTK
ncbi:mariner Mos1 transposase [Trichonephila clavipes]|nr:mariner Mos1 transposase [Trichonephila clavipes]